MPNKKNGLGKGLSAIFSSQNAQNFHPKIQETAKEIEENLSKSEIVHIDIDKIKANEYQPRKVFDDEKLQELAESIKKYGVLQPLLLTKIDNNHYELIAGERRLRASKLAGLKTVPAIIKTVDDLEKFELALIENIQRQDLNPIEKAESYKQLIDAFNLTQEEAAKRLGLTRTALANTLRLLTLPSKMQLALAEGKISEGQARSLLSLNDLAQEQEEMFKRMLVEKLPVRKVENMVREIKGRNNKLLADYRIDDKREKLQNLVQSKVEIRWNGKKGKIIIDVFSLEDIDNLIEKLER